MVRNNKTGKASQYQHWSTIFKYWSWITFKGTAILQSLKSSGNTTFWDWETKQCDGEINQRRSSLRVLTKYVSTIKLACEPKYFW